MFCFVVKTTPWRHQFVFRTSNLLNYLLKLFKLKMYVVGFTVYKILILL